VLERLGAATLFLLWLLLGADGSGRCRTGAGAALNILALKAA